MSKTKLIALSGVCGAVSLVCLIFTGYATWIAFILAVMSSVAVAVPVIVNGKNLVYSVLTWISSSTLGLLLAVGKIYYVVPVVFFAMPMTVFKVFGESSKTDENQTVTLDEPFGSGTLTVTPKQRPRVNAVIRWIVYYVLLEISLALTVGTMYLFTPDVLDNLVQNGAIWWLLVAGQIVVVVFDFILNGAIKITRDAVRKSFKY